MRKTIKKMLSLFIIVILAAACLAGCGTKTSSESQTQSQYDDVNETENSSSAGTETDDSISPNTGEDSSGLDFSKHTYQIGTRGMEVTIETDLSKYIYRDEIDGPLVFHALDLADDLSGYSIGAAGYRRFDGNEAALLSLHFGEYVGDHVEAFDIDVTTGVKGDYKRDVCSINIYSGECDSYVLDIDGRPCYSDYAPLYCYILENANEWLNSTDTPADGRFNSPFYNWLLGYYEYTGRGFIID